MRVTDELADKRVLVLGLGIEGLSTLAFLRKQYPDKIIGLADKRPRAHMDERAKQTIESDPNVTLFLGPDYLEGVEYHDIIFRSPGIPPSALNEVMTLGKILTSNTELFFERCPGRIVGVTGTKGKSTTASMIYEVLKEGGVDARLVGNIGIPPLSSLESSALSTIFIAELSSYQLVGLRRSPHIAVIQNIVPEHLNYHETFEAYVEAKQTIVKFQKENDYVLFNDSYPIPQRIARRSKAVKIPFGFKSSGDVRCYLDGGFLVFHSRRLKEKVISVHSIPLKGNFNTQNVMPSIIVGKHFGVSSEIIAVAIQRFRPLEHRLEYIGSYLGVSYYNDSLSTIPEATIAAMEALNGSSFILLVGGYDRGLKFTVLAQRILAEKVRAVILFPTTGEQLWEEIVRQANSTQELPEHVFVSTMADAVKHTYGIARDGDTVVLSPAAASFSTFRDYRDRGEQFKMEVKRIVASRS